NVMNEMYARDISRKVRSAHRIRGNSGEPLSQPPYGYMKSPENKKRWIIDPEASGVVREIFKMYLEGKGIEMIARELQERQVLVPQAYWTSKGLSRSGKKTQSNPYKWCKTTISKILAQQDYCGDVINFKTYSRSFKKKERLENPPENWAVFKDVHEPIIDRQIFQRVQDMLGRTKHRALIIENGEKSIFSDLIRCADCGRKMWYRTNTRNRSIHYFLCSNYKKDYRGTCDSRHYIRADAIETVVKQELGRMAELLRYDEDTLSEILAQKTNAELLKEKRILEENLQKAVSRNETVAGLYEKIYEDNAAGKVTDEWFMQLSHKYEVERMELKEKITTLHDKLDALDSRQYKKDAFIAAVRKFMEMETLTAPLLQELIDHIDVYETEGTGTDRIQRIVIYYRFVGYIELPEAAFRRSDNYKANTRQGVAVEYIPQPA
ncbi:MAG: recombinase family protein, partial [Oscillospiraceae bacterium]|nr:recombinase family protein [Oscillospiraceae bacterium]